GRWSGRLPPSRRLDIVGVVVCELERCCALFDDVRQISERRAHAQQQAGYASAQPKRFGDTPRELPLQALMENRQTLWDDLRAQRRRGVELLWKLLGARQAKQPRAVDINDVERD